MNNNPQIGNLGEKKLIKIIEDLVLKKTGKELLRDDSFFFDLKNKKMDEIIVINSDMLVSTTDTPVQMNSYQIGRKSVIMNLSDLLVKGVEPCGLIVSFGLPKDLKVNEFIDLLNGIVDCSLDFGMDYIGGDLNETKEIIINPMVFGFKNPSAIIYRKGIKVGDILIANNKFGLTGVGFDIALNKKGDPDDFPNYKMSIKSILEPQISGIEASVLSERRLATSSIDSSDGLSKSLQELMISNPTIGFEVEFDSNLIHKEAFEYSNEFHVSLEGLVFNGGEEFIHLFTIDPTDFKTTQNEIQSKKGQIFRIGKVISDKKVYFVKEGEKKEVNNYGFEHFSK